MIKSNFLYFFLFQGQVQSNNRWSPDQTPAENGPGPKNLKRWTGPGTDRAEI